MISTLSMLSSPKLSGKHFRLALSMRQPPTRNASRSCLILAPSGSLHACESGVNPILEKSVKRTCTVTLIHLPGTANLDSLASSFCISQRFSLFVMQPKEASSPLIRYMGEWPRHQPPWLTAYSLDSQRRQEPQQSRCHLSFVLRLSLFPSFVIILTDNFSLTQPPSHECDQNISFDEPFCTLSQT